LCVWGKSNENNDGICGIKNTLKCEDHLTISGCTYDGSSDSELKMVCEWDNTAFHCSNSSKCNLLSEDNLDCANFKSEKGPCFFNRETNRTKFGRPCSDVVDITDCNQFLSSDVCRIANKNVFVELSGDPPYPCVWTTECISSAKNSSPPSPLTAIVIVVVVISAMALVFVVVLVTVIIYRKREKLKLKNMLDSVEKKQEALESLYSTETRNMERQRGFI
jgi:hypothetical protein